MTNEELGRLTLAFNARRCLYIAAVELQKANRYLQDLGVETYEPALQVASGLIELRSLIPKEGNPANGLGENPSQKEPEETGS